MSEPYILLVDDDTALLQALPHTVALRIHGVNVDTADSASEALTQIQLHDYDAIVSDIRMPGMDGLELLARIREIRPETPTLLITGHADAGLLIEAMRTGAYAFIQNPPHPISFVAALHRAMQTRQLQRQVHEQQELLQSYAHLLEKLVEHNPDEAPAVRALLTSKIQSTPFQPPIWLI